MTAAKPTTSKKRSSLKQLEVKKNSDLYLLLVLSLLLRLVISPFFGYLFDLQGYVNWGIAANHHFLSFYSAASGPGTPVYQLPNYPPLLVYLFSAMTWSYVGISHLFGMHAPLLVSSSRVLMIWMKVPAILFDLATIAVIYHLASKKFSQATAFVITAAYAFSPAVLLDGAVWGQTDGIPVFFLLMSLLCMGDRKHLLAGFFYGLALVTKIQVFIFLPLLLWYSIRWMGWRRASIFTVSFLLTALLACLPYLVPPHPEVLVLYHNIQLWTRTTHVSNYAFNLWWLFSGGTLQYSIAFLNPLLITLIGWGLFLLVLLFVLLAIHKDNSPKLFFYGAALISVAFFMLAPEQLERYLYPSLCLLLILFLYTSKYKWWYALATVSAFGNMLLFLFIRSIPSVSFLQHITFLLTLASFLIALGNGWLLVSMIRSMLRIKWSAT